jgi:hypothetical protein
VLDFLTREPKIVPSNAELILRVDALKLELARAIRRIEALEAASPAIPAQRDLADCTSARKLLAYIGRAMGDTSADTAHLPIRAALLKSDKFADLRTATAAKGLSLTDDLKILGWLAGSSRIQANTTRYELIFRGAYTARSLAVTER